jgi:hypothetical protein
LLNATAIDGTVLPFERILTAIEHGHLLDILEHTSPEKYPNKETLNVSNRKPWKREFLIKLL